MVPPIKFNRIFLFILASVCLCGPAPALAVQTPKYIRVAVIRDVPSLRLKISGSYEIRNGSGLCLDRGRSLNTTITTSRDGIRLGKKNGMPQRIRLAPVFTGDIVINGRKYKGDIEIIREGQGRILAVNYIESEDYIKGILYNEASHYWPQDALMAQSIVCRSYAVYQIEQNRQRDFDVTCDIYSQVYGGSFSERYRTNIAVDQTKGQILTFNGAVLPAYFHATCAGHTQNASELWNINMAPLKGVSCDFCRDSPHFSWHSVLDLSEIEKKLNTSGRPVRSIKSILILGIDASGRVKDIRIRSAAGDLKISAKDFRNIIGPNIIRSANFKINIEGSDAVFEGLGWGHGVGLCQWGAYFMAKAGKNYEEILKYYYPGSEIRVLGT